MPALLTDTHLCETLAPAAWRETVIELEAFQAACQRRRSQPSHSGLAPLAEMVSRHARLLDLSAVLLEPSALDDLSTAECQRLLARSLLLVMRLQQALIAPEGVLDTAGARTLPLFEADFFGSEQNRQSLRRQLQALAGVSVEDFATMESELQGDLADAQRKQAIVRALRREFGLASDSPRLQARALAFFQALFPHVPLTEGEVALVATGTLLFFCVPFVGEELTTPRAAELTAAERQAIAAFLQRNARFTQQRFANFPAFGALPWEDVDPALLERVAAEAQVTVAEVRWELPRLVTVLPLDEIDKYIVHDVWGHGWQASMLRFEQMYETMASYADPLRLDETALSTPGSGCTFGGCFCGTGEGLMLDEARFRQFVLGEFAERLPVAMSAALAEMLADVMEFKVLSLAPQQAQHMPSSSWLQIFPSKLDLTLDDLPFYFSQATKVFRLWAPSEERRQRTIDDLTRSGAAPAAAAAAVARAAAIWQELNDGLLAPRLHWRDAPDHRLEVNVFTRVALNFLGIHRAIVQNYERLGGLVPRDLPWKSCRDLLVLGASVFFEADRPRNLWRVDEFLSLRLAPFCQQLASDQPGSPWNTAASSTTAEEAGGG